VFICRLFSAPTPTHPLTHNTQSMIYADRENDLKKALEIVSAQPIGKGCREKINTMRRNYSSSFLLSWSEPKSSSREQGLDWQGLVEEGREVIRSDSFMEDFITEQVLQFDSFSEAICNNIASSFETKSTPKGKFKFDFYRTFKRLLLCLHCWRLISYFMWSGALDSSDVLQSYSVISLAQLSI